MPENFDPETKRALLTIGRRDSIDTIRLLSLIPVLPHHVVADVGCGEGYFTVALAKYLFDGKVFALDGRKELLNATQEALKAAQLTNVEVTESRAKKLPIEDEALDGVLLAFVLHAAGDPKRLIKETYRCLRKGGWSAILEWRNKETAEGPPLDHRIGSDEMASLVEGAGFRISSRRDVTSAHYLLVVRK